MSVAKEYCLSHERIGYISALSGFEIFGFEYGIEDYCYAISGAWCSKKSYHRLKIHYTDKDSYVICNGTRLKFSDSVRG